MRDQYARPQGGPATRTLALSGQTVWMLAGAAFVLALAFWLLSATLASAHHPTYSAWASCNGWSADASYVGGTERRLILISEVKINGADFAASWANSSSNPPPNDSGDGGFPTGTNQVIAYNSYGGPKPAACDGPIHAFADAYGHTVAIAHTHLHRRTLHHRRRLLRRLLHQRQRRRPLRRRRQR